MEITKKDLDDFFKSAEMKDRFYEESKDLEMAAFLSMMTAMIKKKAKKEGMSIKYVADMIADVLKGEF